MAGFSRNHRPTSAEYARDMLRTRMIGGLEFQAVTVAEVEAEVLEEVGLRPIVDMTVTSFLYPAHGANREHRSEIDISLRRSG